MRSRPHSFAASSPRRQSATSPASDRRASSSCSRWRQAIRVTHARNSRSDGCRLLRRTDYCRTGVALALAAGAVAHGLRMVSDSTIDIPTCLRAALVECLELGVARFEWRSRQPLGAVAAHLSLVVRDERRLRPTASASQQASLSGRHGFAEFPWHTDSASSSNPPRFLLMRSVGVSEIPTLAADSHAIIANATGLRERLSRSVWCWHGGARPFYASVLSDRVPLRFNPDVMRPASRDADAALTALVQELDDVEIIKLDWGTPDVAVMIDNHRMLHARPAVPQSEVTTRTLERIHCDGLGQG